MHIRYLTSVALACGAFNSMAADIPTMDSGNHSQLCTNESTKRGELDRKMFDYCMEKQQRRYAEFKVLANKYKDHSWIQSAIDYSVKESTNRGVRDDASAAYTLDRITEGWEDMVYEAKQPNYDKSKYEACYKKWNPQFHMIARCYKK